MVDIVFRCNSLGNMAIDLDNRFECMAQWALLQTRNCYDQYRKTRILSGCFSSISIKRIYVQNCIVLTNGRKRSFSKQKSEISIGEVGTLYQATGFSVQKFVKVNYEFVMYAVNLGIGTKPIMARWSWTGWLDSVFVL